MTGELAPFLAELPGMTFCFMLVLARVGAAMMVLPGLGEADVPAMVRAGLALAITVLLVPAVLPLVPAVPEASLTAAGMVGAEVLTGLWLGWLSRLICLALPISAQFIAYLLGVSSVLQADVELGPQTTALSRLFSLAVPPLILASGLYVLPLTALSHSFQLVPPGALLPAADSSAAAVAAVADCFAVALRLASPFIVASIVWHVAVGLIARLVPRMHVYFVSMPGQIVGGLAILVGVSGAMLAAWQNAVGDSFATLPGN